VLKYDDIGYGGQMRGSLGSGSILRTLLGGAINEPF